MNCDPQSLMDAARCYRCIPDGMRGEVMIFLLCQLAESGGGGGGGGGNIQACLVTQSGAPVAPCAFSFGISYDDDTNSPTAGSFWFWSLPDNQWIPFSV